MDLNDLSADDIRIITEALTAYRKNIWGYVETEADFNRCAALLEKIENLS